MSPPEQTSQAETEGMDDSGPPFLPPPPGGAFALAVQPSALSPVQRLLLTTDGTVSRVLEAYAGEPVEVLKLSEIITSPTAAEDGLDVHPDERVLRRSVLIRGACSGAPFIHADSVVLLDRLDPAVAHGLLHSDEPIGRLLFQHRIETLRELVVAGQEPAGIAGHHFGIGEGDPMLCRTYLIVAGQRPIMSITERFPTTAFP